MIEPYNEYDGVGKNRKINKRPAVRTGLVLGGGIKVRFLASSRGVDIHAFFI